MFEHLMLFVAAFAAAAISGAAGFGGALLLLPILVATMGETFAVPLLTIAQFIGNFARVSFGLAEIQWKPVGLFLLGAVPLSILGAFSFIELPKELITRSIGGAILIFVVINFFGKLEIKTSTAFLVVGGSVVGFLSGLVGSAGPIGAAIFLSLGLTPVAYVASEAATALTMHGIKTIVYHQYIDFDREFWLLAMMLGVAMILGTWSAKRFIHRMPQEKFRRYVSFLLFVIASYMLIHG
jgi:uncharacterized membrane protein YfcA